MDVKIEKSWKFRLKEYFNSKKFENLANFVKNEYRNNIIFPEPKDLFNAFNKVPFEKVSVVIIGQDPYHGIGQAHGLCFSVKTGVPLPPSLKNIYKEIESDLGIKKNFTDGNLENWANQGVFLLNSVLTVKKGIAGSHANKGWEEFSDYVIEKLAKEKENLVFMLWGNYAKKKGNVIDKNKHLVLIAPHPSPFSAYGGFFGCKHFSKANDYLQKHGKQKINW